MRLALLALASLAAGGAKPARAAPAAAGPVLVELFTSQGCSSCPAAERFVGELPARGFGPDKAVVLTFHVDYWDRLGWSDPFAGPELTARQEWYARSGRLRPAEPGGIAGLYTPQMIVGGRTHFPGGQTEVALRELALAARRTPRAALAVQSAVSGDAVRITVRVTPIGRLDPADDWRLNVALVQKAARTAVPRGENGGETLDETALVRRLSPRLPLAAGGAMTVTLERPPDLSWSNARVAVWLQSAKTLEVGGATQSETTNR
jgi:hypothetical protein